MSYISFKNRFLQFLILASVCYSHHALSSDLCSAQILSVLKTDYKHLKTGTVSEKLHEESCSSSNSSRKTTYGNAVEGIGELSFSNGGKTVNQACQEKDYSFFRKYSDEVAISVMPDSAMSLLANCAYGLSLKANVVQDIVNIRASYNSSGNGILAKITSFTWTPSSAMDCAPQEIKKVRRRVKVTPGGINISCTRSHNETVNITLSTDQGDKSLWINRTPIVKDTKFSWGRDVKARPNSGETRCKNQFGPVGGFSNCRGDQTCDNKTAILGLCLVRHGYGYSEVDGKQYKIENSWSYEVKGGPNTGWTTCTLNGIDIGTPHDCRADGSCGNANAITGSCAGRYGL